MKHLRYSILTAALLAVLATSANAQSKSTTATAPTKVATVDMKKLFNGYYKTKLAQASLENRKAELRKEIKEMADGIDKAQTAYKQLLEQSSDLSLSADERDKRKQAAADKAKEITNSRGAIEQFQRQAESQLADQSQRMSGNLVSEIQKRVAEKARAGGYSMVLNSGSVEVVVFANGDNDITADVLTQLNDGAPIDLPTPTGAPLLNFGGGTNTP